MNLDARASAIMVEVARELERAQRRFGPFASAHEGIAVIREEYLELEREVFRDRGPSTPARIEAVQLAAVSVRYVYDVSGAA